MKKSFSRWVSALIACVTVISLIPATFAADATPSAPKTEIVARSIGGSTTTSLLPKNIDGNQGTRQWGTTISRYDVNSSVTVKVSGFTNGMKTVNLSVLVDGVYISGGMEMSSGSTVTFVVPSDAAGKNLSIFMSTNSVQGKCDLSIT